MARKAPLYQASFEEFLALEATSPERHEFVEGLVFAMAGGTDYHNRLVARLLLALLPAAERAGCDTTPCWLAPAWGPRRYHPMLACASMGAPVEGSREAF